MGREAVENRAAASGLRPAARISAAACRFTRAPCGRRPAVAESDAPTRAPARPVRRPNSPMRSRRSGSSSSSHDLAAKSALVVAGRVERGVLRRVAALGEIELDDRLAERHVLDDLVHGRHVVHRVRHDPGSRRRRRCSASSHSSASGTRPVNSTQSSTPSSRACACSASSSVPSPTMHEVHVARGRGRARSSATASQQVVEALLLADHADIARRGSGGRVAAPAFGGTRRSATSFGAAAHDEHAFRLPCRRVRWRCARTTRWSRCSRRPCGRSSLETGATEL